MSTFFDSCKMYATFLDALTVFKHFCILHRYAILSIEVHLFRDLRQELAKWACILPIVHAELLLEFSKSYRYKHVLLFQKVQGIFREYFHNLYYLCITGTF